MTPHPQMSVKEVLNHHITLASKVGLEGAILDGSLSHVPKWHAFSILGHIRQVIYIAKRLVEVGAANPSLVTAAAWHDVGKVIAVQHRLDGPTFHHHEKVGAAYLKRAGTFPEEVVMAILYHGSLRSLESSDQDPLGGNLWKWLELCDELGKWTKANFPPSGSDRTWVKREQIIEKLIQRGLSIYWVRFAEIITYTNQGLP